MGFAEITQVGASQRQRAQFAFIEKPLENGCEHIMAEAKKAKTTV